MADELEITTGGAELETPDTAIEGQEGTEGAESDHGSSQQTDSSAAQSQSGKDVYRAIKDTLRNSPDHYKQVKTALHMMDDINRRFPDGIAKTAERLELISQLDDNPDDPEHVSGSTPIEQVISNTIAERTFWRDYDNAFQEANPAVINQMVEANPESFQKLIPSAMDCFAELNPEGYSSYICKSVSNYLADNQIPLQLALLDRVLPQTSDDPGLQTVIEAFKAIKSVVSQIETSAKSPIQPKAAQQQQNGRDDSLESRERNILHDEWLRDIRPRSESFTVSEIQRMFPKVKFTASEISEIKGKVRDELNARVAGNPGYQKKVTGFLKANNKTAYSMTVESEHKKIIGGDRGAAKRAVDDVLAKRKTAQGKKSAQGQTQQQERPGQSNAQQQNNSRFEYIAQSPTRLGLKVDFRRTSNDMLARNEAYIAGRTNPVKWKRPQ